MALIRVSKALWGWKGLGEDCPKRLGAGWERIRGWFAGLDLNFVISFVLGRVGEETKCSWDWEVWGEGCGSFIWEGWGDWGR